MPHNTDSAGYRKAAKRLDADKAAHGAKAQAAKKAVTSTAKLMREASKTERIRKAKVKVRKAQVAQKVAHAKLKQSPFSKLKAGIKALTADNNARSERIKKQTGIPTDIDKVRAKAKKKMKEIGL